MVREDERYIFVERIIDDRQLANLRVFEFDENRRLVRATKADTATYLDDGWDLQGVEQSQFSESAVSVRHEARMSWPRRQRRRSAGRCHRPHRRRPQLPIVVP